AALLRSRAVEAGLDPQFAVLEQAQAETLLAEAADDEVRRLVSQRDETTLNLAVQFGLDGLREMLRQFVIDATPELLGRWWEVSPEKLVDIWQQFSDRLLVQLAREVAHAPAARQVLEALHDNEPANSTMQTRRQVLLEGLRWLGEGTVDEKALTREALR